MNWNQLKKPIKFILKLGITLLALAFVFRNLDIKALVLTIEQADIMWILGALIVFFASKYVEAIRLNFFFKAKNLVLTQGLNFKLYLLGMFYNLFFPGGIGGDSYKAYWLTKNYSIDLKSVISSLIFNRINGLIALCVLIALSVQVISFEQTYIVWVLAGIPLAYASYITAIRRFFADYKESVFITSLISLLLQGMQLLTIHLILVGLGVGGGYEDYWFIYLISGIAFIIPVTVGGVGSREVVFFYGSQLLEIDLSVAITLSLILYCMRAMVSLFGAYYVLSPDKLKLNS
ncbi:MAG: hypothetical protein COB85_00035 [Bacteroidetes bacterium]|nr:MAG: hypothetical protein COB85_00035 [Bacteroidota bacterium]